MDLFVLNTATVSCILCQVTDVVSICAFARTDNKRIRLTIKTDRITKYNDFICGDIIIMLKFRLTYLITVIATIVIGLLSRHWPQIPLLIGDILWATMVYFGVRLIFAGKSTRFAVIVSLAFSYGIEFSQLYKAPWIEHLRHTLFGRLVLGETFLWGDLLSYTAGIMIGVAIDSLIRRRKQSAHLK